MRGARIATVDGGTPCLLNTFRRTSWVTRTSMTREHGVLCLNMEMCGFQAASSRVGLPITMAIGPISRRGDIPGSMISPGDLRLFITGGGFRSAEFGVGYPLRRDRGMVGTFAPCT